jgi:chromosome segregation ATPase
MTEPLEAPSPPPEQPEPQVHHVTRDEFNVALASLHDSIQSLRTMLQGLDGGIVQIKSEMHETLEARLNAERMERERALTAMQNAITKGTDEKLASLDSKIEGMAKSLLSEFGHVKDLLASWQTVLASTTSMYAEARKELDTQRGLISEIRKNHGDTQRIVAEMQRELDNTQADIYGGNDKKSIMRTLEELSQSIRTEANASAQSIAMVTSILSENAVAIGAIQKEIAEEKALWEHRKRMIASAAKTLVGNRWLIGLLGLGIAGSGLLILPESSEWILQIVEALLGG